jgi:glucokinase
VPLELSSCTSRESGGCVLGVDVGGTRIRAAVAAADGTIEAEADVPTDTSGDAVVAQLLTLTRSLIRRAGREGETLTAAVIGVPGVPDQEAGFVRNAPNVPALQREKVIEELASGLPIVPLL